MSSIVFPAEWEPQAGVVISWPAKSTDWRDQLAEVEATYLALAEIIIAHGHLYICCCDTQTQSHVQQLCNQQGMPPERYTLITIPYNDTWTRDYGPISVRIDEQTTWLDFKYNAWGGKFAYQQDNRLTQSLYQQEFMTQKRYISCDDFVLEGGSIDSDGDGTLLTTSQCLLSPGRNPALSKQQIEEHLQTRIPFAVIRSRASEMWSRRFSKFDPSPRKIRGSSGTSSEDVVRASNCTKTANAFQEE
jgi:agmatine deiminase